MDVTIVDFDGQYRHLIDRSLSELGYDPDTVVPEAFDPGAYDAAVLSGGPHSVTAPDYPGRDFDFADPSFPRTLGICYGHQLLAHELGGTVEERFAAQYDVERVAIHDHDGIFADLPAEIEAQMSHGDTVTELPPDATCTATCDTYRSDEPIIAGFRSPSDRHHGIQFHPETFSTPRGDDVLANFLDGGP